MRIVVAAANGDWATPAVRALVSEHELAAVIRPARSFRAAVRHSLRSDPLSGLARQLGVREHRIGRSDRQLAEALEAFRPDVLCILTFPWLVGPRSLAVPRVTSINVHPSLLPRHRGPNPYFWQYFHGDERGGISIHVATDRADAGPVWVQSELEIPRGFPVQMLHDDLAQLAAKSVPVALRMIAEGAEEAVAQDPAGASAAPRVGSPGRAIDFEVWGATRVWHLLKGMCPRYREDLRDEAGSRVRYRSVGRWCVESHERVPGTASHRGEGWILWCRDGFVELSRRSR